jgi:hypothetical protein
MEWSWTYVIVQIIAGILGGQGAAVAAHEHRFGALGHTVVGAIGGGLSGYFLQTVAATVVTGSGSLNEPRFFEQAIVQGLAGAVAGGIAMLAVGLVKYGLDQHKSTKGPL